MQIDTNKIMMDKRLSRKEGKIDTIFVKDLFRFGLNYIQIGQYIDYILLKEYDLLP